jgi:dTMP kinase
MRRGRQKGIFITFEGIDGSGKTTQAERLADFLASQGRGVVLTREPGGTEVSEKIRAILLDGANHRMAWLTEMFLYMASRAQHTEEIIKPALDKETIVISDRYMDATVAYQGYGRGLDTKVIRTLNAVATSDLIPDVTILVDAAPELCQERMAAMEKTADRMEGAGDEFQHRVREGYLEMATREPDRFRIVDGSKSISELEKEVQDILHPFIS